MNRFFVIFSFNFRLMYHKTLFDEVVGLGYRTTFVIYVTQLPAKSINWLMYIYLHVVLVII